MKHPHGRIVTCTGEDSIGVTTRAQARTRRALRVGRSRNNVFLRPPQAWYQSSHASCAVVVRGRASGTPCLMASGAGIAWKRRRQAAHAVLYVECRRF
ncbi:hypothetical protein IG631_23063 [Alternaria alternata]|nr:hypothetical protein IG631_23063 [Alternaria alternata]